MLRVKLRSGNAPRAVFMSELKLRSPEEHGCVRVFLTMRAGMPG